jgi:hypothetical protein
MIQRIMIAVVAIGLMSLSAFAQTPELNEVARKATAAKVVNGLKTCAKCDLFQVDFSYKELSGRDLSGSRLRQADLSLATLDDASLRGANLSVANGFGARFSRTDLSGADMTEATFVGSWFGGANLAGANLKGTNLSGSYLYTAKGLTQVQLSTACGDESTEVPEGLKIPLCPGAEPSPQLRGHSRTAGEQ